MRTTAGWCGAALVGSLLAWNCPAAQPCSREQEDANRKLIESLNASGPGALEKLMHPDYVQHNVAITRLAEINGVGNREATELMGKVIRGGRRPPPVHVRGQPRDDFAYQIVTQCDLVVVVGQHWHPDPERQGKFYATYFFNMWRIKDGKLYEHWDPDGMPDPLPEYLRVPLKDLRPVAGPSGQE